MESDLMSSVLIYQSPFPFTASPLAREKSLWISSSAWLKTSGKGKDKRDLESVCGGGSFLSTSIPHHHRTTPVHQPLYLRMANVTTDGLLLLFAQDVIWRKRVWQWQWHQHVSTLQTPMKVFPNERNQVGCPWTVSFFSNFRVSKLTQTLLPQRHCD